MSLTKKSTIDQITIEENGIILYRTANVVFEDDKEIVKDYVRTSLSPGQDLSEQPKNIVDIANLIWTEEIISAYKTYLESQLPITQSI